MSHLKIDIDQIKKDIETIKNLIEESEKKGITSSILLENEVYDYNENLYNKYPWIVKHLCRKEDTKYLDKMINALERVSKGELTIQEAGKDLGEELAEKYIYPQFGRPEK